MQRIAAVIEIVALGVWVGASAAFAFLFAPLAFGIVGGRNLGAFAALIAHSVDALAAWGEVAGTVAIACALLLRAWPRVLLVALALVCVTYETRVIVPAMTALGDPASPAYHALHARSTQVYGAALLAAAVALILAAASRPAGAPAARRR